LSTLVSFNGSTGTLVTYLLLVTFTSTRGCYKYIPSALFGPITTTVCRLSRVITHTSHGKTDTLFLYRKVLSAPVWGFNDVFFRKDELRVPRAFKTHVVENVLFKPSFPCEYHAQTAVEACFSLHPQVVFRVDEVREIAVSTTRSTCCISQIPNDCLLPCMEYSRKVLPTPIPKADTFFSSSQAR
jgi:hypothetical protein